MGGWIDRDPGRAFDSTEVDFAECFATWMNTLGKTVLPIYWMWGGWTEALGQSQAGGMSLNLSG